MVCNKYETKSHIHFCIRIVGFCNPQLRVSGVDEFSRAKPIVPLYCGLFCGENQHLWRTGGLYKRIFCTIVLPIYYLPKENYKLIFYTFLEIGTPSQKIPLLLNPESNSFGITSCFPKNNYTNKKIYNFNITGEFLKNNNYDYFNKNKSSSFILYDCIEKDFFKAEYICPSKDTISFFGDINLKNKIQKIIF